MDAKFKEIFTLEQIYSTRRPDFITAQCLPLQTTLIPMNVVKKNHGFISVWFEVDYIVYYFGSCVHWKEKTGITQDYSLKINYW